MPDEVIVLQSSPAPKVTTNPYIVMLQDALTKHPTVVLNVFSWRQALFGRYDVFHVHWPEILVSGTNPLKRWRREILTGLLLVRLRLRRTALVRTLHNVELPQGLTRVQVHLLNEMDKRTTLRIALNDQTPSAGRSPHVVIPHGHYRDWYARQVRARPLAGRAAFVGLVRRYKGVEQLIEVFRSALDRRTDLSLTVGGLASSMELEQEVRTLAAGEGRISLALHFLDDNELVRMVTSSQLVVLPYRFMHNSGGTIAALSLDRPVLVPDNPVNRALSAEVGENWVYCYRNSLDVETLLRTMTSAGSATRSQRPNLSAREWDSAGQQHFEAYQAALRCRSRFHKGFLDPTA